MKSKELVEMATGAIGRMFGRPQQEIGCGELAESIARGLGAQTRGSRWGLPTVVANYRGINYFGLPTTSPKSREWPRVSRDHSRPRRGNRR